MSREIITKTVAKRLGNGTLPRPGRERLVLRGEQHYWMSQTPQGWELRETAWRLVDGRAVLGPLLR